jgi:SAM-dependent methyltransferase
LSTKADRQVTQAVRTVIPSPCPVCDGISFDYLWSLRDNRTRAFSQAFDLARCTTCQLIGLRPMPDEEQILGAYEFGYGPHGGTDEPRDEKSPALGRSSNQSLLRHVWHFLDGAASIDRVEVTGRVLDVGANQGDNVELLRHRGYDAVGVEPNPRAVKVCLAKGLPVVQGTVESARFEQESFDTVILSQVLEHLVQPDQALLAIHRLLRPGGRLIALTPNVDGLQARLFGSEWANWHVPYHVYLYGPRNIRELFLKVGFQPQRLATVSPGEWFAMSLQLWHRKSQVVGCTFSSALPKADRFRWDVWLRLGIWPMLRILDVLGKGDCLIAVGRKK